MKIATWNINGIKARNTELVEWIQMAEPDIICLQEIKAENIDDSPINDLGYNIAFSGQKGFNGVAIMSKAPIEDVTDGLPGDKNDNQARFIKATISVHNEAISIVCIYLPNGNPVDADKFPYKLKWMDRLKKWTQNELKLEEKFLIAGDFNVIPHDIDCWDPKVWEDDALTKDEVRDRFFGLVNLGMVDALRATTQDQTFTFWDYQKGAWQKDHGIRIDHILLSPEIAPHLKRCKVDKFTRGWEKPSDHVPVWAELNLEQRKI